MRATMIAVVVTVLVALPRPTRADDVADLRKQVTRLEADNEALREQVARLKKEVADLKAGPAKKPAEAAKPGTLDVGTRWKGKAKFNGTTILNAVVMVAERSDKSVKLSVSYENGAVWVFECSTEGARLKIKETTVEKGRDVDKGEKAVAGGTTGGGNVQAGKLTFNYIVPPYNNKPGFNVSLTADLEK